MLGSWIFDTSGGFCDIGVLVGGGRSEDKGALVGKRTGEYKKIRFFVFFVLVPFCLSKPFIGKVFLFADIFVTGTIVCVERGLAIKR